MIMPLAYFCGFSVMDSCATATNMAYFGNDGQRIMHAATCKKDQMVLRGKDQRFRKRTWESRTTWQSVANSFPFVFAKHVISCIMSLLLGLYHVRALRKTVCFPTMLR